MSDHPPMPLADAERIAAEIVEWLRPVCERIEVAGSVRRRKPEVRDIEIVCVPKIEETALDLFGQATDTTNVLDAEIARALEADSDWADIALRLDKNGKSALGSRYKRLLWLNGHFGNGKVAEVALDLFSVLPPAQWGVIMAIRTGPAEFSRRLVTRKSEGGLLYDWMRVRDGRVEIHTQDESQQPGVMRWYDWGPMSEERDLFAALGIPWIEPEERR